MLGRSRFRCSNVRSDLRKCGEVIIKHIQRDNWEISCCCVQFSVKAHVLFSLPILCLFYIHSKQHIL